MRQIIRDLVEFHTKFGVPILERPQLPPPDRAALRMELIREEVLQELLPAMEAGNLQEIADGIIDSIYVLVGAGLEYGLPLQALWDCVHEANMAKVGGAQRADGKILRPEGWTPPDIAGVLEHDGGPAVSEAGAFFVYLLLRDHLPVGRLWDLLESAGDLARQSVNVEDARTFTLAREMYDVIDD